ncbi:DmpA/ArgJ-like protein [Polychaeton citri CBS 116435]|uniref:DmpA/ArgJ-like protein n=1 Tax=Polychaeton citri CBS 116435 TaxID=1314669 RepID=A0A9P4UMU3_9PEZI|nr:DmpA/ArgJ-like protein [Polychaeton citri CBS 116435]
MASSGQQQSLRIRDLGYTPGELPAGPTNSILDVPGVHVSQHTVPTSDDLPEGSTAKKGCTIISARSPKDWYKPCHASTFTFNGNGELTGSQNIADWGFINTPIIFTNSFSVGSCMDAMWDWMMEQKKALGWDELTAARNYGSPVVGETCDWWINSEVEKTRLDRPAILETFSQLKSKEEGGSVQEGQAGGGASMTCHHFTGGTGTASRVIQGSEGKTYTLGALVQSNYGVRLDLHIGGVPVGKILAKEAEARGDTGAKRFQIADEQQKVKDGSILILIMTDAPLATHNLNRLARHATVGLTSVGGHGVGRNFSGDIFLAVSTADIGTQALEHATLGRQRFNPTETNAIESVKNESIDTYFYACAEAVEEAILNSMVASREGTVGMNGDKVEGFDVKRVQQILDQYLVKV